MLPTTLFTCSYHHYLAADTLAKSKQPSIIPTQDSSKTDGTLLQVYSLFSKLFKFGLLNNNIITVTGTEIFVSRQNPLGHKDLPDGRLLL